MQDALDSDRVADVELLDPPEGLLAELVAAGVGLDLAAQVADVEEGGLAVAAPADQPPGDPVAVLGVLALAQRLRVVGGQDVADLVALGPAARRVGVDAFGPQLLQLGAPDLLG